MASAPQVLLTGAPGSGKTTLVKAVARGLDPDRVVGFLTEEIREGGERRGFRVALLHEEARGVLARVDLSAGPRVGRYRVDVTSFERTVLPFLEGPLDERALHVLDEVGKMECFSSRFERAVARLLESGAGVLATVPLRASGFPAEIRSRPGLRTFHLRPANRAEVQREIEKLLEGWRRAP